jgi:hypothetical protein
LKRNSIGLRAKFGFGWMVAVHESLVMSEEFLMFVQESVDRSSVDHQKLAIKGLN